MKNYMQFYNDMELTKKDTKMTQGLAIIFMVLLHLFCKTDDLPYVALIKMPWGTPLIYYIGLISDCCVAIYCFCSGYALYLINSKTTSTKQYYIGRYKSILKLLINYWIVLIVFCLLGLFFDKDNIIPGNIHDFCCNFFLYRISYNGAWWFVLTYIFIVILSRWIFYLVKKCNMVVVNIIAIFIYVLAYFQKNDVCVVTNVSIIDWFLRQIALIGTSFLPFVWGMLFKKYEVTTKIKKILNKRVQNWQLILIYGVIFICLVIAHGIVQSLFVAPFVGLAIIIMFNTVKKGKFVNAFFEFLGNNSTNIWLTHMFFYLVLFKGFVFIAKYPPLIFILMMLITLATSTVINFVYKPICKLIK